VNINSVDISSVYRVASRHYLKAGISQAFCMLYI
jgi:hypothetical protein